MFVPPPALPSTAVPVSAAALDRSHVAGLDVQLLYEQAEQEQLQQHLPPQEVSVQDNESVVGVASSSTASSPTYTFFHSNASNPHYFQGDSLMTYVDDNHSHPRMDFSRPTTGLIEDDDIPYEEDLDMSDGEGGAPLATAGGPPSPPSPPMMLDNAGPSQQTADEGEVSLLGLPMGFASGSGVGAGIAFPPPPPSMAPLLATPSNLAWTPSFYAVPTGDGLAGILPHMGVNADFVTQELQQLANAGGEAALDLPLPPAVSDQHPGSLGSENPNLHQFLRTWAEQVRFLAHHGPVLPPQPPRLTQLEEQMASKVRHVRYDELCGDECDPQGLNWSRIGVSREEARKRRQRTYKNYTNKPASDMWRPGYEDGCLPATDNFFRFRRMMVQQNVYLAHFQLRSLLACASRTKAFYPSLTAIHELNPVSGESEMIMNLSSLPSVQVSTLGTSHGILAAGTFNGEYAMRNLDSQDPGFVDGQITAALSGITNHLQIHGARRSASPLIAFASNDQGFRIMDVQSQTFLSERFYDFPMNCSSISPDKRLRIMVGDHYNALVTNAETGEILQELKGHRDYGFACDWSDDGWTVATGFQDKGVKIWDARRWTDSSGRSTPLCTIRSELAGVRGLKFSPLGSGRPVLIAAEEADYVNIIDAQTMTTKQTFDIFGEIGGVAFANEGRELNVLCCDPVRGGLLQLDRCDTGAEVVREFEEEERWRVRHIRRGRLSAQRDAPSRPVVKQNPPRARGWVPFMDEMEPF